MPIFVLSNWEIQWMILYQHSTGVLSLIMQGFGVGLISKKFSDMTSIKFSAITLAMSFYALVRIDFWKELK